ncbi:MAG: substrate-binding domain-containing protein [Capsulimonadaceae bacterium]
MLPLTKPDSIQKSDDSSESARVRQAIIDRIKSGGWKPGELIPDAKAMAVEYQATHEAASRAMRQLVDEGMLRSSRDGRTVISPYLNGTTGPRKTLHITVLMGPGTRDIDYEVLDHDNDHLYYGSILRGIVEATADKQVEIHYDRCPDREYVTYFGKSDADGVILIAPSIEDLPILHDLLEESRPFVATSISSSSPEHTILPCVDAANREGARSAAEHLVNLGHRRIGVINLCMLHANHVDRLDGFRDALNRSGIALDEDLVLLRSGYDYESFETVIEEWLDHLQELDMLPTAVFACDFQMMRAALMVFQRRNMVVPADISLVGFDDPLAVSHLSPPMTTVRQPVYGIGLRAGQRLIEALTNPGGPRMVVGTEILRTQLMVRESTGPPPVSRADSAPGESTKCEDISPSGRESPGPSAVRENTGPPRKASSAVKRKRKA